jgi:hypothetical protein
MANMTVTDIDTGDLEFDECEYEDGVVNFSGADTLARGTILARHSGTLKFQIFQKGGSSNGNGTPVAVLSHELVATASGDLPCRAIVHGDVNVNRLIIDADGDASNIDAAVRDQLRDYKITPVDVKQNAGALFTDEDS